MTQKRLKIIGHFFKNPQAPQLLRRTSLGLQITGDVVAMTCKKDESHASEAKHLSGSALLPEDVLSDGLIYANRLRQSGAVPASCGVSPASCGADDRPAWSSGPRPEMPLLVRLCCGAAQELAAERRTAILRNLHCDPSIDVGATMSVVLGAGVEIAVRFEKYKRFPFRLCFLIRTWFPVTYIDQVKAFLKTDRKFLDLGLSLVLQSIAIAKGGSDAAVDFLQSEPVQDVLIEFVLRCEVTSLPAERLFNCVKKWETSKLVLAGNVSCDLILQRFARDRREGSCEIQAALDKQRKAITTGRSAILCAEQHIAFGGHVARFGKGRVRGAACQPSGGAAPSSSPASSGAAPSSLPASSGAATPPSGGRCVPAARRRRRTSADGGDADFGDTGDADIESTLAVGRQPQRRRRRLSTQARGGDSPTPSLGGGTVTTPVKPTKKAVYSPSVSPAVVADAAPAEASRKRELLLRESAREVEAALAKHSGIPVTRTQVRFNIQENLEQFRGRIVASRGASVESSRLDWSRAQTSQSAQSAYTLRQSHATNLKPSGQRYSGAGPVGLPFDLKTCHSGCCFYIRNTGARSGLTSPRMPPPGCLASRCVTRPRSISLLSCCHFDSSRT